MSTTKPRSMVTWEKTHIAEWLDNFAWHEHVSTSKAIQKIVERYLIENAIDLQPGQPLTEKQDKSKEWAL